MGTEKYIRWTMLFISVALIISFAIVGICHVKAEIEYDAIVKSMGRIPLKQVEFDEYEIVGHQLEYSIDSLNIHDDKTKYLRRSFMDKVRFWFRFLLGIPISIVFGSGLTIWLQRIPERYRRTRNILCSDVSLAVFMIIGTWFMISLFVFY